MRFARASGSAWVVLCIIALLTSEASAGGGEIKAYMALKKIMKYAPSMIPVPIPIPMRMPHHSGHQQKHTVVVHRQPSYGGGHSLGGYGGGGYVGHSLGGHGGGGGHGEISLGGGGGW